jgi:hypothetical protein
MYKGIFPAILFIVLVKGLSAQFTFVSPLPDSKNHRPECGIILKAGDYVDSSSLHKVQLFSITGSISGSHDFDIILADDGKTILLRTKHPYNYLDQVTVEVKEGIENARGRVLEGFTFRFEIRPQPSEGEERHFEELRNEMMREKYGNESYHNDDDPPPSDDLPPFTIDVNTSPAEGAVFYHNLSLFGLPFEGPAILTSEGEYLFNKVAPYKGLNFTLNENGYLTMYDEISDSFEMLDSSFMVIDHYAAGNGYPTDIHDFQVFSNGHSIILGLDYQSVDMTVYDPSYQSNATVIGAILQELDASKNVIFEWRSWDYIDIPEALHEPLWFGVIDYVHANSFDLDTDGNILLSCRNLDQVIKINRQTGEIMWRLGGVENEFTFINDTLRFTYQHDARRIANGNLTLYDNGNYHPAARSYAKEYQLDEVNKTATLVWSYAHPLVDNLPVIGYAMGNVQRLSNGNTFINWGSIYIGDLGHGSPNLTEVDAEGNIVWEMTSTTRIITSFTVHTVSNGIPVHDLPPSQWL